MAELSIDELVTRVEKGIVWLTEHDPDGSFNVWFESGISPHDKMPAQTDERRAAYAEYHKARRLWDELDRQLVRRGGLTP